MPKEVAWVTSVQQQVFQDRIRQWLWASAPAAGAAPRRRHAAASGRLSVFTPTTADPDADLIVRLHGQLPHVLLLVRLAGCWVPDCAASGTVRIASLQRDHVLDSGRQVFVFAPFCAAEADVGPVMWVVPGAALRGRLWAPGAERTAAVFEASWTVAVADDPWGAYRVPRDGLGAWFVQALHQWV